MEPIISPWFFYFADLVGKLAGASGAIAIVIGIIGGFVLVVSNVPPRDEWAEEYRKAFLVIIVPIASLFLLGCFLLPSKQTMYRMMIASKATPENIEKIVTIADRIKGGVKSDVVEIIKEIKKEEK